MVNYEYDAKVRVFSCILVDMLIASHTVFINMIYKQLFSTHNHHFSRTLYNN